MKRITRNPSGTAPINSAGTTSLNVSANQLILGGVVSGGSLTKSGSGILVLAGANTFTGTNTFTPAKFFPANTISRRLLFQTNSIYISSVTAHADNVTNNGDYALCTGIFKATLPALLGSNSIVVWGFSTTRTNLTTTLATGQLYVGPTTNWMSGGTISSSAASLGNQMGLGTALLQNNNSFTSQYQSPAVAGSPIYNGGAPASIVDTSSPWDVYVGVTTVTSCTNMIVRSFWFEEIVIP